MGHLAVTAWARTADGLPPVGASGQVKVLFGDPGWAGPILGLYDGRLHLWLEYDAAIDRYHAFEGPRPPLYLVIPEMSSAAPAAPPTGLGAELTRLALTRLLAAGADTDTALLLAAAALLAGACGLLGALPAQKRDAVIPLLAGSLPGLVAACADQAAADRLVRQFVTRAGIS